MSAIRLLAVVEANTTTGPAKNLLQFAGHLGEVEPPVELALAVFRRAATENGFIDAARRSSIPVYAIDERRVFDARVLSRLRAISREFQPHLVQTHSVKSHFLVRAAGLHKGAPWVAFHHGYTWPDWRMRVYNQLDRWSLRAASLVLTVSVPFRRELTRLGVGAARIEVVHNAIDAEWGAADRVPPARRQWRARLGIGSQDKVIVIVGRLSREKDHNTLLHAVHALPAHGAPALPWLLVVGDGPERAAILETAGRLGISGRLILTGQVPSAAPYYGIADVAVLSSVTEGSPNALLEAMASGVPVVATSVGGVPEIVSHNATAMLAPPSNPGALADAIAAVLEDETLGRRLAESARELVVSSFAPAARTRRIVEAYSRVLRVSAAERVAMGPAPSRCSPL